MIPRLIILRRTKSIWFIQEVAMMLKSVVLRRLEEVAGE